MVQTLKWKMTKKKKSELLCTGETYHLTRARKSPASDLGFPSVGVCVCVSKKKNSESTGQI